MARPKPSPGFRWAEQNLLNTEDARAAWGFQLRLEQSQWYTPDQHRTFQLQRLTQLLRHARQNVPHYAETLAGVDLEREMTWERFRELPLLSREQLQENRDRLTAATYPSDHGEPRDATSSGSTGRPITVAHTALSANWHRALTFRTQLWTHKRFDGTMAVIRRYAKGKAAYPEGASAGHWADDATLPVATGPVATLEAATRIPDQAEWLARVKPQALTIFPSSLAALAAHIIDTGASAPKLRAVQTVGEAHGEGLRGLTKRAFGAEVSDTYSAAEIGGIALQCPETDGYHVHSEAVIVEVVDETGEPCPAGQTGRVILTPLHNYATPLIRYEIGDYATVGRCKCGRGMPVLKNILGRQRNMMVAPDGTLFWPSFGLRNYAKIAPVKAGHFVQEESGRLIARLVSDRPLDSDEEDKVRKIILSRLPAAVEIGFDYVAELPRNESGKFEDFVSRAKPGRRFAGP